MSTDMFTLYHNHNNNLNVLNNPQAQIYVPQGLFPTLTDGIAT